MHCICGSDIMPPEKCAFEGCPIIVSEKAAQTTRETLLKPYCERHAQQVIAETADQADTPESEEEIRDIEAEFYF